MNARGGRRGAGPAAGAPLGVAALADLATSAAATTFTAAAALLLALSIHPRPADAQRYLVHNYTEADGLPSPAARDVVQDDRGLIWVATRAGVASYDGAEWRVHEEDEGLPRADYGVLALDPAGDVWVATSSTPLEAFRREGSAWVAIPAPATSPPRVPVVALVPEVRGGRRGAVAALGSGEVLEWDGEEWRSLRPPRDGQRHETSGLWRTATSLTIATRTGLLRRERDAAGAAWHAVPRVPRENLFGLVPLSDTDAWIVGADWLGRLEGGAFRRLAEFPTPFGDTAQTTVRGAPDGVGGLLFGQMHRVYEYDPEEGIRALGVRNGLVADGGTSFFRDRESNLWIASARGLSKIISRRFAGYDHDQGLAEDEVTAIRERRPGEFVLGHPGAVTILGDDARTIRIPADPVTARVLDLELDAAGRVWIAAAQFGLGILGTDDTIRWIDREIVPNANAVLRDGNAMWIGGSAVLLRAEAGAFESPSWFRHPGGVQPFVRRLSRDRAGAMWISASGPGSGRWDGETFHPLRSPGVPGGNDLFAFLETKDGDVLVGTDAGLFRCVADSLVRAEPPGPALDRPVYFLLEDRDGRVWIGSDDGVHRWDGEGMRAFGPEQGLIGTEANRAAAAVDGRGRVWIGTDRGLSIYDARLDPPRPAPVVRLLAADVSGQRTPVHADVVLPRGRDDVTFRFQTIAFSDERNVRFRTYLEGWDRAWNGPDLLPEREARVAHLPPGRYRFHVQAVDVDGRNSEVAASGWLRVRPPLAREPVLFAVGAFAAAALAAALLSWGAERRAARRLERAVSDRTAALMEARRATEDEKERLHVTLQSILEGVVLVDGDGRVAMWNDAAERITGHVRADVIGRSVDDVFDLPEGTAPDFETTIPAANGEERRLEMSFVTLSTGGGADTAPGAVLVFRDVTERRAAERETERAQRLESIGVLAGGIAHDFNNLLAVIMGYLSLMQTQESLAAERGMIGEALSATQRASALTQQLLTFAKGGAPVRRPESIAQVVRESAAFVRSGTDVRVELDLPDDLAVVEIDGDRMNQVLHNLLLNAAQAMPPGGVVRVRARNVDEGPPGAPGGPWVLVEVEDEGAGIAPADLERVFDPYFTTKAKGSGLGLTTAYSIVGRHDGHLSVESRPGEGSTFRIHLPAARAGTRAGARPAAAPREARFHGLPAPAHVRGRRVLVMDDEELVRATLRRILEDLGCDVVTTDDGRDAVSLYRGGLAGGGPFDAVFLDLTVPGGMGGLEALRQLREIDPDARAVVTSGYHNDPVLADARGYGFRAAVPKPFRWDLVAAALEAALAGGGNGSATA